MKKIIIPMLILILSSGCKKADLTNSCQFSKVDVSNVSQLQNSTFFLNYNNEGIIDQANWDYNSTYIISAYHFGIPLINNNFKTSLFKKNTEGYIIETDSTNCYSNWKFNYDLDGHLISAISNTKYSNYYTLTQEVTFSWFEGNIKETKFISYSITKDSVSRTGKDMKDMFSNYLIETSYNQKPNQLITPLDRFLGVPPKNQWVAKYIYNIDELGNKKFSGQINVIYDYNSSGCISNLQLYNGLFKQFTMAFTY